MANLLKLGITYASDEPQGPRRGLENLCESAWFTKQLAGRSSFGLLRIKFALQQKNMH